MGTQGSNYIDIVKVSSIDLKFTVPGTMPNIAQQNLGMLNSGNVDMTVDGSVTPVLFENVVPDDELHMIYSVPMLLVDDTGTMSPGNFGGNAALANGLELVTVKDSVEVVVCNLKTNKDLTTCFFGGQLGSGNNSAVGFMNTAKFVTGSFIFDTPLFLDGSKGDRIFFRVQDNLTVIDHLEGSVKFSSVKL